jgi:hypothetical protein
LLTMGLPSNVVMAMLLGALIIHGVTPGPLLISQHPEVFWGVVASMYLGNVMLLVLNLPLIGMWVQFLRIPYPIMMPLIILFCLIGSYTVANSVMDILFMLIFGVIGYFMKKFKYEAPPFLLAFVLGPLLAYLGDMSRDRPNFASHPPSASHRPETPWRNPGERRLVLLSLLAMGTRLWRPRPHIGQGRDSQSDVSGPETPYACIAGRIRPIVVSRPRLNSICFSRGRR